MNRKREEELIRLAFGDLHGVDADQAVNDASNDPVAAETLRAYRQLRAELKSLGSVPAPQMSKEMLRDRLLVAGLRPGRSGWGWAWGLAPLAAGILGFMFMTRGNTEVPRIPSSSVAMVTPTIAAEPLLKAPSAEPIQPPVSVASLEATTPRVNRKSVRLAKRPSGAKRNDPTMTMAMSMVNAPPKANATMGSGVVPIAMSDSMESKKEALTASTPVDESVNTAIVLIQPDKDQETGANRATEISSSNVVIGG